VPGYESSGSFGFGAPRKTPPEIVERLNKEINAILADPKAKTRIAELGGEVLTGSPAAFGRLLAAEAEKWAKVVKAASIKA
jgi:tripartite-type tricarboxylate transporter receptor subunit TctC